MKIIRLEAENVKKIRAVDITPDGAVVQITGKNAQGKTSVLDSIWWALSGAASVQKAPIRKGQQKAAVKLNLGELIVERRFTQAGTTLVVESADGQKFSSPQAMLDTMLGELSFDPLAFARMPPRSQFDELRRVAKVDIDVDSIETKNKADYDRRTEVNRQAKAKKAQADAITVKAGLPDERIDDTVLLTEMEHAADHNRMIDRQSEARAQAHKDIAATRTRIDDKRKRAAGLRAEADQINADAVALEAQTNDSETHLKALPPIPALIDVTAIRQQVEAALAINAAISQREQKAALEDEARALSTMAESLTKAIEKRSQSKMEAIAKADMPVQGLSLGEGFVTFNGIPFEQASDSEKLRVSLGIAMAANPKLRVIRIQDGSLLDADAFDEIAKMAAVNNFQVWIEQVDSTGKVGIYIEDGAVKAVNGVETTIQE